MSPEIRMIVALAVGIVVLILMLTKTKIQVFIALLISSLITGILGGMGPSNTLTSVINGFGTTLGSMGIIIALGVIMGKILEVSGGAEKIGLTFLKVFGKGKEEIAVLVTAFITSLAVFCVPAFIILFPLLKTISRNSKKSIVGLGVAAAGGLLLSHTLVPPASGPTGAATLMSASIPSVMLWGFVLSIPMAVGLLIYSKYLGKKINKIPNAAGDGWIVGEKAIQAEEVSASLDNTKQLPSFAKSIAPILIPILLILICTVINNGIAEEGASAAMLGVKDWLAFFGDPVVALIISVLAAIVLLIKNVNRKDSLDIIDAGIASSAKIILIIGAGGALGAVVRDSGVGSYIAELISQTAIPPILLPLIIATVLRIIQGSGNVATATAVSITAPIMIELGVNLPLAALAACVGSMFFSYFNDAYFWTINETLQVTDVKDQIKVWSIPSTICWAIGTVFVLILSFIIK